MSKKLDVIIDARMVDEHLHGIARYTYELIKNNNGEVQYHLLVNDIELSKKIFDGIKNIDFIKMNSKFLSLKEQIELPKIVNRFKGDIIFHSPSFVASPFIKKKMIMTIHDLNHIRYPEFYTPFHKLYYRYIVKTSANKCKKLLTVSEFSKQELVEWLNCSEEKIAVTYNGIDEAFKEETDREKLNVVVDKYNLPEKFILYIGNQKPHKNVITLIRSIPFLDDKEISLVINGKLSEECYKECIKLNIEDRVKSIGFVDDKDLSTLYSLAEAFVFPSLYEGFGLPPLEAMACGCPTIVSNAASLPEVVKDGALIFDVLDYKGLSDIINKLEDIDINSLKDRGIIISNRYNWRKCYNQALEVYKCL